MPSIPPQLLDESVLRRLLDESPLLYVAITGTGEIRWMSEAHATLLGHTPADLVGTNILDLIHPDDHAAVIDSMAVPAGAPGRFDTVEIRVTRPGGDWMHLEIGGIDLRASDGSGLYLAWGRTLESTTRLSTFLAAVAAGATLDDLVDQILAWFLTGAPDHLATASVRHGHRFLAVGAAPTEAAELGVTFSPGAEPTTPWDRAVTDQVTIHDRDLSDLPEPSAAAARAHGARALTVVPVRLAADPAPAAMLCLWHLAAGGPTAAERRRIQTAAQFLQLALEWNASHAALITAATTDHLTGLTNRAQLAETIRTDRSDLAAVLFCDLDDFKVINDRHGHLRGDQILQEVARRLQEAVRSEDVLARLGGDEFAVFCRDLGELGEAEAVAARMVAALDVPIELAGRSHRVGCSVGVAPVRAPDRREDDVEALLNSADRALYRAKAAGKGRWMRAATELEHPLPFPGPNST